MYRQRRTRKTKSGRVLPGPDPINSADSVPREAHLVGEQCRRANFPPALQILSRCRRRRWSGREHVLRTGRWTVTFSMAACGSVVLLWRESSGRHKSRRKPDTLHSRQVTQEGGQRQPHPNGRIVNALQSVSHALGCSEKHPHPSLGSSITPRSPHSCFYMSPKHSGGLTPSDFQRVSPSLQEHP